MFHQRVSVALLLLVLPAAWATGPAPQHNGEGDVREQLARYFSNLGELAPTTLATGLPASGDSAALLETLDRLDGDQLARFSSAIRDVPDWGMAPEALAGSLPAEMRARIDAVSRNRSDDLQQAEALRQRVTSAARSLLLLGDEQLAARGISAEQLSSVASSIDTLDPIALLVTRDKLEKVVQQLAPLESLVSPELRHLASTSLRQAEFDDSGSLRRRIDASLASIGDLPAPLTHGVHTEALANARRVLSELSPGALATLGSGASDADWSRLERTISALSGARPLTDDEVQTAEHKRNGIIGFVNSPGIRTLLPEQAATLLDRIGGADASEIPLMWHALSKVQGWQELPVLLELASSDELEAEIAALGEGSFDRGRLASLETFRESMIEQSPQPGVAAQRIAAAWESASYEDLVFWDRAASVTSVARVKAAAIRLVTSPGIGNNPPVIKGCGLSISCYVGKVKDALADAFASAIHPISDLTNQVANKIVEIGNTVSSFAQSIPDDLWRLMSSSWQSLASLVEREFGPEGIVEKLGLVEGFWNDIPNLPEIPCPPIGTNIAFFGEVGDADAALRYNSYLWIFDQLLEMLPDTSVSLQVKIPAHVIHSSVEFLGICMENAAEAVAEGETGAYQGFVNTGTTESLDRLADLNGDTIGLHALVGEFYILMEERIAEARHLLTANAIEANLLAAQNDRVASFMLPRAAGGYIELVREIVSETIDKSENAGATVIRARELLAGADDQVSGGEYRLAYDGYRLAYRSALGSLPGDARPIP